MIENITPQIKTLLAQNRKLEAISLAFEQMGNLSEAKSYVTQLENELSGPVTQEIVKLDTEIVPENTLDTTPAPDMDEIKKQALHILTQEGSKLKAVKWVIEQTGWGLKESKSYVDDLQDQSIVPEDTLDAIPSLDMDEVKSHVLVSLGLNKKLYAVKWVRDQTDWSLKESKTYVDDLQVQNAQQIKDLNLIPQIIGLLEQNRKLEAVKFVKMQTSWGLREAKDYVDHLQIGL